MLCPLLLGHTHRICDLLMVSVFKEALSSLIHLCTTRYLAETVLHFLEMEVTKIVSQVPVIVDQFYKRKLGKMVAHVLGFSVLVVLNRLVCYGLIF